MGYIATGASRLTSTAAPGIRPAMKVVAAPVKMAPAAIVPIMPSRAPRPSSPIRTLPKPGSSLSAVSSVFKQPVSTGIPPRRAIPVPKPPPLIKELPPQVVPMEVVEVEPGPFTTAISQSAGGESFRPSYGGGKTIAASLPFDIPEEMLEPLVPMPSPPSIPWKMVGLGVAGVAAAWFAYRKWGK